MKIYNEQYELVKTLEGHKNYVVSVIELKDKNYIVSGSKDSTIRFWNTASYLEEKTIQNISCYFNNSLIEMRDKTIIVGGEKKISIIKDFQVQREITFQSLTLVTSVLEIERNTILCGTIIDGSYSFMIVNTKDFEIENVRKAVHSSYIGGIIVFDCHTFGSSSDNGEMKIWKQ